jgi:AraC family transcriptional regulator, regulatory protein of adaptative response / methylated-DNA-[protein]-cysteine methyltransferase
LEGAPSNARSNSDKRRVSSDSGVSATGATFALHAPLDLPLDVQATAFQYRVWQALRAIPYGSTKTYSQIAKSIGDPKATRAVARACATNPVSIVVPCHRVVRQDGNLAGYRWGLARKQTLLDNERQGPTVANHTSPSSKV